jgi:hypothetical protein
MPENYNQPMKTTHRGGPTLSKFGAHLRWLIEKSEIDPEGVVVSVQVKNSYDQSMLISTMLCEFDGSCMQRYDQQPHMVVLHGVPVWVMVTPKKEAA